MPRVAQCNSLDEMQKNVQVYTVGGIRLLGISRRDARIFLEVCTRPERLERGFGLSETTNVARSVPPICCYHFKTSKRA